MEELPIRPTFQDGSLETQQRPEVDFASTVSDELTELKAGIDLYDSRKGTPNQPLLDARAELAQAHAVLRPAEGKLKRIESQGSFLQQFEKQVLASESLLKTLLDRYTNRVIDSLIEQLFGQKVAWSKLSSERRQELQLHKRVTDLRKFQVTGAKQPSPFDAADAVRNARESAQRLEDTLVATAVNAGATGPELARARDNAKRAATNLEHDLLLQANNAESRLQTDLQYRADEVGQKLFDLAGYIAADSKR